MRRRKNGAVRVLVAEPDELLATSYHDALAEAGFEVETATSGVECATKLRAFQPRVLVLEPEMQWGQGEGVLCFLQEEAELHPVAVVMINAELAVNHLRSGKGLIQGWLRKPFPPNRLAGLVFELSTRSGWLPAHRAVPQRHR